MNDQFNSFDQLNHSLTAIYDLADNALCQMSPSPEYVNPEEWVNESYGNVYLILESIQALAELSRTAVMTQELVTGLQSKARAGD